MKKRRLSDMILTGLAVAALIFCATMFYVQSVQESLWEKSVTDILEITAQGQYALDTYIQKDYETVRMLANELSLQESGNSSRLMEKLSVFSVSDEADYKCMNPEQGTLFMAGGKEKLREEAAERLALLNRTGVLEPYLDGATGVKMFGVYAKFQFSDGALGVVLKERPLSLVADQFSLSFYNYTGFSYIVRDDGEVLLRSNHRNSNRSFQNLFDIIDLSGNNGDALGSFHTALREGQKGVAQFRYNDRLNVFCYVPMSSMRGWYVVSIVPNTVIMEQGIQIIRRTLILCGVILAGVGFLMLLYRRGSRQHRREMERLAFFDGLTGLSSFEKFKLDGAALMEKNPGGKRAALYVDIPGFKLINDISGYEFGDKVLRQLAGFLTEAVGESGLTSRVSADNFVALVEYQEKDTVDRICRSLLEKIYRETGEKSRGFPVRIGVCCQEDAPEAADVNSLIDRARIAQKSGKASGDHRCRFYSFQMRAVLLREVEIESAMQQALEDGEFVFYVQPKYDVFGEMVVGGEALARWLRPNEGIVSPAEFIPLFERNQFILKLDAYIFTKVCQELRLRLEQGLPVVPISVNVSRVHLYQKNFAESYIRIKDENGIPDGLIELELTESILLEDIGAVREIIETLKQAGFGCSIDDFGSGYSSLNALKDLPTDVIKLDREFLQASSNPGRAQNIIRCVIDMARKLEMRTVAEGVETAQQLEFLQTAGCDMIQGFIFSKPLPQDRFDRLLDDCAARKKETAHKEACQ